MARLWLGLLAGALLAGILAPGAALAQNKIRKADCFFEADGKVLIDGICQFLTDARSYGTGGFRVATIDENGRFRNAAIVYVSSPGSGTASWTQSPGEYPEAGPSERVTSRDACWTGSRTRICAWKVGEGRPGFATPASAEEQGTLRAADCFLEVGGEVRLDGFCMMRSESGPDSPNGFELRSRVNGKLGVVAKLLRDAQIPTAAYAFWNGGNGAMRAADALGSLDRNGPCWQNGDVRLCVWQAGESRGTWDRRAGGTAPRPASPPSPPESRETTKSGETTETGDPPPGMVLKLTFKGRCEALVIDGEDAGSACSPTATNESTAGSSQAVFTFGASDNRTVMFLASAKGWVENGTLHQPIDQLRYEEGAKSTLLKAKGVCEMPNPMGGPVVITCTAQSANSSYSARFRTDGGKPSLERFSPG